MDIPTRMYYEQELKRADRRRMAMEAPIRICERCGYGGADVITCKGEEHLACWLGKRWAGKDITETIPVRPKPFIPGKTLSRV